MRLPLHFLMPVIRGIPVLMYHKVWYGARDCLSIDPALLRQHFAYLRDKGLRSLLLPEFLDMAAGKTAADPGSFLLSFDDGYLNHYTLAYPLLRSFGFRATFFITGNSLDAATPVADGPDRKMALADLKMLDPDTIQLALHSYDHIDFNTAGLADIQSDLKQNIDVMDLSGLVYHKVLAYPYGARPSGMIFDALKKWMVQQQLAAAFRIGNKPQCMPAASLFDIRRIDIHGTDSVRDLAIKLRKGKLKPF